MESNSRNLLIFIKNPVLGHAKTRIAATVGDQAALVIYEELLDIVRANTSALDCNKYLYYSSEILPADKWNGAQYLKCLQVSGDLGYKMLTALAEVDLLDKGGAKVLIGSDCPTLTKAIIEAAFEGLIDHDVVLGPTYDGGYYLIGMKQICKDLFKDIAWSTEEVFQQSMAKAQAIGYKVAILPMLNDIDDEADWVGYKNDVVPK